MSNIALPNPAQQSDINASLLQSVAAIPLLSPVVTVTPLVPGSTTQTYAVVTKVNGEITPGTGTTTTGASTLAAATPNTITWNAPANNSPGQSPAPVFDVYRTVGGATQGKIASNITGTSLVDSGLVADGTTAPAFNTSGTTGIGVLEPVQVAAVNGAITIVTGKVLITKAGVAALTLAQPIAGSASAGGHDGAVLTIISTTANAHTVTTAANGINGSSDTATFSGTLPNAFSLTAYNGKWYSGALTGVTLSEV